MRIFERWTKRNLPESTKIEPEEHSADTTHAGINRPASYAQTRVTEHTEVIVGNARATLEHAYNQQEQKFASQPASPAENQVKPDIAPVTPTHWDTYSEEFNASQELRTLIQLPTQERKECLAEIKEAMRYQQSGFVRLSKTIEEVIQNNPSTSLEEFKTIVDGIYTPQYKFNREQQAVITKVCADYVQNYHTIHDFALTHKNPREAFTALFGFTPTDEVHIQETPFALRITIQSYKDFANAAMNNYYDPVTGLPSGVESAMAGVAGVQVGDLKRYPAMNNKVILENEMIVAMNEVLQQTGSSSIHKHEEQHTKHKLLPIETYDREQIGRKRLNIIEARNPKELEAAIAYYAREQEKAHSGQAKDEILAFTRQRMQDPVFGGGNTDESIAQLLTQHSDQGDIPSGAYDYSFYERKGFAGYIHHLTKDSAVKPSDEAIKNIIERVFIQTHSKIITAGFTCVTELRNANWDFEQINGLLGHEPLERWPKILDRYKLN